MRKISRSLKWTRSCAAIPTTDSICSSGTVSSSAALFWKWLRIIPAQRFFVTTFLPASHVPRNIMFVNMGYFGAAYGAGVLAALISEKKQAVGFIGGDDDPNQQRMKKAFIAGAQHTVPGIRAMGIITGDYDNAAKGREAASILIGNGADVIWHSADITGLGAIQGAVAGHIKVLGCYSDQTALAPNNMATSFEMNLAGMVFHLRRKSGLRHVCGRHRVAPAGR